MNVKMEQSPEHRELEVLIKYARFNKDVRRLQALLSSFDKTIACECGTGQRLINAADIYYAESVDKRTYVYCEKEVYRCGLRLYRLLDELSDFGFVQVSKSCILNLNVLTSIRPLMNSRMEASLSNGEKINVTRKYVTVIKNKLLNGDSYEK